MTLIAQQNGYNLSLINEILIKIRLNTISAPQYNRYLTLDFNTDTQSQVSKAAFRTNTHIFKRVNERLTDRSIPEKTGVYKIKCGECDSFYTWKTGRARHK